MTSEGDVRGTLAIYLGTQHAGDLLLRSNDFTEFRLSESFRELPRRPVLGQVFEEDPTKAHIARMRLPPFFSNLLPEGRLRDLIAGRLDVSREREFFLLAQLGEDLPGNVRAVATGEVADADFAAPPSETDQLGSAPLKFSLAGVQLKLSMLREGRGMTLPTSGRGGDWIVKLPGKSFVGVPENEYATMNWARLSGLEVPQVELIAVSELRGLPEGLSGEGTAYAVRRFDRPAPGQRVHIEDFAQIRNVYPDSRSKYSSTNYETLGKLVLRIAGEASFEEFVRRLAFVVVSANADAHIKNWSLIYPDAIRPRLSPAYDLVSTIEFIETDALALNLAKSKAWEELSMAHFTSFAERIGADSSAVTRIVRETVERSLDLWAKVQRDFPVSKLMGNRIKDHWRRLPLVRDVTKPHPAPGAKS